jgi:hypothetical protein
MKDQGCWLRMWKAMRALGAFTIPELVTISEVPDGNARNYIFALRKAGYIRREHKQKNGTRQGNYYTYRLIKNTGPKAPTMRVVIHDPNLEGQHVD